MPPMPRARRIAIVVGTLALIASAGLLIATTRAPAAPSSRSTSLELAPAEVTDFDIVTISSGALEAKSQIELRNRLESEAAIVEIVPEGSSVKKGDVVVRLNTDQIQQQIDQQLLELEQAKNQLASAESAYEIQLTESAAATRKATLAVELAQLDFQQWLQGEVETKRQKHRLDVEQARSEVSRLTQRIDRTRTLRDKGFVSAEELQKDEIELRKQQSSAETAALQQRVFEEFQFPKEQKQKQSTIDEAIAELKKVEQKNASELASKTSTKATAQQTLSLREARLDKLTKQKDSGVLVAPSDGLVVYGTTINRRFWGGDNGPLQIGRRMSPNELIVALPDPATMIAAVKVPESLASRIKPGQSASIVIDAIGGRSVTGTVDSIGVLAEGDSWLDPNKREFRVAINLGPAAQGLGLRPSMRCDATIMLERVERALAVPVQAVFMDGPVRYVHIPDGNRFAKRPVQIGRRSDRFAEVLAGVAAGDRVLLRRPDERELNLRPFSDAELATAGFTRNPQGEIVSATPPDSAEAAAGKPTATVPPPAGG
jgi:HlyD family secretion protein